MTKEEAFNQFDEFFESLKCGDNSCIFGAKGGMGTNGGCQTQKSNMRCRRELSKLAQKWRELKEQINE